MNKQRFRPGNPGIIGRFEKQRWTGPKQDRAETIDEVQFDATDYILNMPLNQLQKVEDCAETSDRIGEEHVDHDGPFSVYIEQAICEFFKVQAIAGITPQRIRKARVWLDSLPQTRYSVRLSVTTYVDVTVQAQHPSQLKRLAFQSVTNRPSTDRIGFVSALRCPRSRRPQCPPRGRPLNGHIS